MKSLHFWEGEVRTAIGRWRADEMPELPVGDVTVY